MYTLGDSISIFNCIDIQQELIEYVTSCDTTCEFDLSSLCDIDAAGVQLLSSLKKLCDKNKLDFKLLNVKGEIKTILFKVGLETLLDKGDITNE